MKELYKIHSYTEKPECTCTYKLLKECLDLEKHQEKCITHSRKCEVFWYNKIEARLKTKDNYLS